jgi:hypothetical protein
MHSFHRSSSLRFVLRGATLFACLSLGACAAVKPNVDYEAFGHADPDSDDAVVERYKSRPANAAKPPEVMVLVDTIPEGIDVKDGKVTVKDGYDHELLGKFVLVRGSGGGISALYTFSDYEAGWHKGYCYPQVVLNYATLTLWSLLVPTAYPCWGDNHLTKKEAVAEAKHVAAAAGGDLVVFGYGGAGFTGNRNDVVGAAGFIFRKDPRLGGKGGLKTRPMEKSPTRDASDVGTTEI